MVVQWCKANPWLCALLVAVILHVLGVVDLMALGNRLMSCVGLGNDGFASLKGSGAHDFHPVASEEGSQEGQLAVKGRRTPATCYPQQTLKAEDLLPEDESKAIQEFNAAKPVAEGIMAGNLLDAGKHIGVNTVGQSLRNANRQLRSEPPNPQVNVSPWQNTTIGPDLIRRPLEISESCGNQQ